MQLKSWFGAQTLLAGVTGSLLLSSSSFALLASGILVIAAVPATTHAQRVTVSGTVVERSQSSWIGGATVRLSGFPPFFTDLDGKFRFYQVAQNRHMLSVQAMGYQTRSLELDIRSDTTLTIELDPDPIILDSLLVWARDITIKGDILDARTGAWVSFAMVSIQPDLHTVDSFNGRFTIRNVPAGRAATVLVEAVEYYPARIALITEADTALTIRLEPDPVGVQLIAEQIQMLETRSNRVSRTKDVIDREGMAVYAGWTIYDMVRTRLNSLGRGRSGPFSERYTGRMACLFIDEVNVGYPSLLKGLTAAEVDRVEIYNRGKMIRVYTKRFLINMLQEDPGTLIKFKWGLIDPLCGGMG
jgi:hypothetical protein